MATNSWYQRLYKTVREVEWISSLLEMVGARGVAMNTVLGATTALAGVVASLPLATVVTYGFVTAAAGSLLTGAWNQRRARLPAGSASDNPTASEEPVRLLSLRQEERELEKRLGNMKRLLQPHDGTFDEIIGRRFENETLELDGRSLINCVIGENVTVVWNGVPFRTVGTRAVAKKGSIALFTRVPLIKITWSLLELLDITRRSSYSGTVDIPTPSASHTAEPPPQLNEPSGPEK